MRTRSLVLVVAALVTVAAIAIAAGPTYSALTAGAEFVVTAGDAADTADAPGAADSTDPGPGDSIGLVTIDEHEVASTVDSGAAFIPLATDDRYHPGRTFHTELGVADNDPDVAAAVSLAVVPMDPAGTGQVGASPNLTPLLRVTVVDTTTGEVLVGGSATDPTRGWPVADAAGVLGHLAARDADPLDGGDRWTEGAPGSRHDLAVSVYCPDGPAVRALTDSRSDLALLVYGIGQP